MVTPSESTFTSVALEAGENPQKKKKVPRRILHFSDGILEEYSTDEEEETKPLQPVVDPVILIGPNNVLLKGRYLTLKIVGK